MNAKIRLIGTAGITLLIFISAIVWKNMYGKTGGNVPSSQTSASVDNAQQVNYNPDPSTTNTIETKLNTLFSQEQGLDAQYGHPPYMSHKVKEVIANKLSGGGDNVVVALYTDPFEYTPAGIGGIARDIDVSAPSVEHDMGLVCYVLYHDSGLKIDSVRINIYYSYTDNYGNQKMGVATSNTLAKSDADQINWSLGKDQDVNIIANLFNDQIFHR